MTGGTESVIRVRGLRTGFGPAVVHDGVDMDVRRGEIFAVVGGSGAGKTVLLNSVIGLNRPRAGTVEVLGQDTARLDAEALRLLKMRWGVLFQQSALFSSLTVLQNVQVPLKEFTDLPEALTEEIAAIKIGMVGLPIDACAKYPAELSGGMAKRAGLARALALDPDILFFDSLIASLRRSLGLTVFMVTHDVDTLYAICDRIGVLVDRIMVVGTREELVANPHPWIQDYFRGPRGRAAAGG